MSQPFSHTIRSWYSCLVVPALSMQLLGASAFGAITSPAVAAGPAPLRPAAAIPITDVALQQGGRRHGQVLQGQVVSSAGAAIANENVALSDGRQQWQARTDSQGWFRLDEVPDGSYQLQAGGRTCRLRAWSAGAAPPHACPALLVTPQTDVVRGQRVVSPNTNQFFRVTKRRLANPLVVGGVVLTAVAIPVAIHNGNDDDPPATP